MKTIQRETPTINELVETYTINQLETIRKRLQVALTLKELQRLSAKQHEYNTELDYVGE